MRTCCHVAALNSTLAAGLASATSDQPPAVQPARKRLIPVACPGWRYRAPLPRVTRLRVTWLLHALKHSVQTVHPVTGRALRAAGSDAQDENLRE